MIKEVTDKVTQRAGCATGVLQRDRDVVSDRRVRPSLIVVSTLILQLFAGIHKAQEPGRIRTFGLLLAVEGFDEDVIRRLARPLEVEGDVFRIGLQIQVAGVELAAIARREYALLIGYGRQRSPPHSAAGAITGDRSQQWFCKPHC